MVGKPSIKLNAFAFLYFKSDFFPGAENVTAPALRLRIASRALIYTHEALSEVALSCGFADQSHFTREFRRQFGRTPREYREHYKLSAGVPVTKTAARKQ